MINHLPHGQRRLLTHISQRVDDSAVWNASRSKGKLTIASDGGLKDIRGTFGWTISTSDNTVLFEGAGPVDGPRDVANSTRCEIAGFAAPMLLLTLFVRQWGLKYKYELATWFRDHRTSGQSREKTDHVPEERVSVRINGVRQVGQVEACIRFHINGYHLRAYLQSKHRWSNEVWNTLDIKVLGQFCRSLLPSQQVAQTKLMYDQRHTGDRRNRVATIKATSLKLCPCSLHTDETSDHVLQCKENPGRIQAIKVFRKSMDAIGATSATRTLKSQLLCWINEEPGTVDMSMVPKDQVPYVELALQHQQTRIGWAAASRGFFSVAWSELASQPDGDSGVYNEARGGYTMRKVLKAVHTLSTQLWAARNHHLHSTTSVVCKQLRNPDLEETP
ncbi:hypothetical protein MHU86_2293 [Fragilaria crotonensis]|nr:hypothetical protein MHU86_2293 [Fragilaria crotonensis]